MKWLRTLILFDQGGVISSEDWKAIHESYVRSIESIGHPATQGHLLLRKKVRLPNGPELTNWPFNTHNGTEHEHHAAFLNGSGGMRSGLNPLLFSDASCRATQM